MHVKVLFSLEYLPRYVSYTIRYCGENYVVIYKIHLLRAATAKNLCKNFPIFFNLDMYFYFILEDSKR